MKNKTSAVIAGIVLGGMATIGSIKAQEVVPLDEPTLENVPAKETITEKFRDIKDPKLGTLKVKYNDSNVLEKKDEVIVLTKEYANADGETLSTTVFSGTERMLIDEIENIDKQIAQLQEQKVKNQDILARLRAEQALN